MEEDVEGWGVCFAEVEEDAVFYWQGGLRGGGDEVVQSCEVRD